MFGLRGEEFHSEALVESIFLSPLTSGVLARFVEEGLQTRHPALGSRAREWTRSLTDQSRPDSG